MRRHVTLTAALLGVVLGVTLAPGSAAESQALGGRVPALTQDVEPVPDGVRNPDAPAIEPVRASGEDVALADGILQSAEPVGPAAEMPTSPTNGATPTADDIPSRELTTDGANLVGVTWSADGPDAVELRSLSDTGAWSPWTALEIADPARGTEPVWVGSAVRVQVRASRGEASVVDRLTLATVRSSPVAADEEVSQSARSDQAAVTADQAPVGGVQRTAMRVAPAAFVSAAATDNVLPPVISRAQWGADESLRAPDPSYASTVRAIALHHTATTNAYTAAESASIIRAIYRYHTVSMGWSDLGYNVIVDRFGQVFEGRAGGLTRPTIGAHVLGYNTQTMGIGMLGDNSSVAPTAGQFEAVAQVAAWKLFGTYRPNAWGVEDFVSPMGEVTRFPPGTPVQVYRIFGHREVNLTACPGDVGFSLVPALRDRTNAIMATKRPTRIQAFWEQSKANAPLGNISTIESTLGSGSWATFSGGAAVTDHPTFGFRVIPKALASGWPGPQVGWPIGDVRTLEDGQGQGLDLRTEDGSPASLVVGPSTRAAWLGGPIRDTWLAMGGVAGPPGYPTRSQGAVGDKVGVFAEFQDGSILWSPSTGAHWLSSLHRFEWWRTGGAIGPAGYPTRSSGAVGDGRGTFAEFQGGSILATNKTGPQWLSALHRTEWWRLGGAGGAPGYPTRGSAPVGDGRGSFTEFEDGSILSTSSTGARWMGSTLRWRWWGGGGVGGFGYPSSSQTAVPSGAAINLETSISLVGSVGTGVYPLYGPIRDRWMRGGTGEFGLPDGEPVNLLLVPGGYSTFANGSWIVWGPQTGAFKVPPQILQAWFAKNGAGGFGLPTAEPVTSGGTILQTFQSGVLTVRQ